MEYRATIKYTFSDEMNDYPSENDSIIETEVFVKNYNDLKIKIDLFLESEGDKLRDYIKEELENEEIGSKVEFVFHESTIKLECHEVYNPDPNDCMRHEDWNLTVIIFKE